MEESHKVIQIKNSLDKSKQALSDAEYNYKDGRYATVLNRIYYSIFYSVLALAHKEGFSTSSHSQLMGWFNKKFIYEEKVFEPKLNDIYKHAYKERQESDYDILTSGEIPDEYVSQALEKAKLFINTVEEFIRKNNIDIDKKEA